MDRRKVSASEVADYGFCARSWWLKQVKGVRVTSEAAEAGERAHQAVGARLERAVWAETLVWVLVLAALVVGLAWVLLAR
jgi:CRISPR/Cas system-associated exonuclease Cas4 (RecB family)